jgi:predicted lipid-binding transport protein (Tim44 family)
MERDRRRVTEATAAAAVVSGAPSTLHALLTTHSLPATAGYVRDATRAIGTLVPPGRPGLARGAIIHLGISAAAAEALARALPRRRSAAWGAAAGLAMGVVNVGLIGRLFPAIRALPLIPQLADHIAFGTVFALVADRDTPSPQVSAAPPGSSGKDRLARDGST